MVEGWYGCFIVDTAVRRVVLSLFFGRYTRSVVWFWGWGLRLALWVYYWLLFHITT